jgi:quercetin dioxygenase-like cupin family protein
MERIDDGNDDTGRPADGTEVDRPARPPVRPVDIRDYVEPVRGQATTRRIFATDQLAVDVWCLEPRTATEPLHLPDRDISYTVLAGRSWFVTDDGEVGLDPLGAILVPADVVHGFENRSPDPLIVLASSAPPGEAPVQPPVDDSGLAVQQPRDGSRLRSAVESLLGTSRSDRPR